MGRALIAALLPLAAGCRTVAEAVTAPVTRRLDLANQQLADGLRLVAEANARVERIEGMLADTARRVEATDRNVAATTRHAGHMDGLLTAVEKRTEVMDGRLAETTRLVGEANKKVDETNRKLDDTNKKLEVVEQAIRKIPGIKP
jgi:chromosome segregation ATPase